MAKTPKKKASVVRRSETSKQPGDLPMDTKRYHVPNLERALRILEHLAEHGQPMGISEIADDLEYPKNSVFRIVSTLNAHGYLRRDDNSKQFALGGKLLSLGYAAVQEGHIVEKSIDIMRQVRDEIDETVLVGILDGAEGVVLEQIESTRQVRVMVGIGSRFPIHTAAPAKAMLAHIPTDELVALLDTYNFEKFTDNTITTKQEMMAAIDEAGKKGYSVDNAEHNEGIRCVGSAVLNQRGHQIGAIWMVGPSFRVSPDHFERLGKTLAAGALRISRRFGYDG